jgi:Putative peptidoglycan binding domain/Caspase domain
MMHTARRILIAMIAIATFAWSSGGGDARGQPAPARVALVIGNAAYTLAPTLPACTASANLVAGRLKAAGFDVAELLDATNGAMGAALTDFAQAIHLDTAAVVYFCGYAVNYQDRDFVLPASATLDRPSDALTQGVVERALDATAAGSANAGPALVLLDLFGLPNDRTTAPTATVAQGTTNGRVAIAVALEASGLDAPTPAATALGTVISQRDVKLPGLIAHLRSLMPTSGPSLIGQHEATADLLLIGEPPKPPASEAAGQTNPGTRASPAASATPPTPPVSSGTQATPPTPLEAAPPPHAPSPTLPPAGSSSAAQQVSPAPSRPPLPDEGMMTHADRRDVQTALARLGYYDGQIDGQFGPDTRAAIRRWQHEVGAEMTGALSGTQATRLVGQQVSLTLDGSNALAQDNRHVRHTQIVMRPTRQPRIAMPPVRQTQIVMPPTRPRPWWQFW